VLIGGDPGIGKSTLLLQALAALARKGERVVYISGEEAIAQVRLRAQRLGLDDAPVLLADETNVSTFVATLSEEQAPAPSRSIDFDPDAVGATRSRRRPAPCRS